MKKFFLFLFVFVIANALVTLSGVEGYAQNWLWARSGNGGYGGNISNYANSVSADANGNVFLTGCFMTNIIVFGSDTLNGVFSGGAYIFVVKYDANGNVLWAKKQGGEGYGYSVSTDASGNAFITGWFFAPYIVFGSDTLKNNAGGTNVFIAKYDPNGNVLWAKRAGGTGNDNGWSVSADASGNAFVAGYFSSPKIIFGLDTLTRAGSNDMFIAKYDSNGNVLWAKRAGGTGDDESWSASADASGNVFVTGYFTSPKIIFGSDTLTHAGIFIAKYDANGNVLWAHSAGGTGGGTGYSVSADAGGNVFVTGNFSSPKIIFGSDTLTNAGVFIAKYDANGNALWAHSAGGTGGGIGNSISADAWGNVFVTGEFSNPTIIFGSDTLSSSVASGFQMFIVKYDANGNVICGSALARDGYNNGVSADHFGNAYIGSIYSANTANPFIIGTDSLTNHLGVFVAKFKCNINDAVNEPNNAESVEVYPNPSQGMFNVKWLQVSAPSGMANGNTSTIAVYNVFGECIHRQIFKSTDLQIDLSSKPRGIYFYRITSSGRAETATGKLVVE